MLVNYAEISRATGVDYKTIKKKFEASGLKPEMSGTKGKSHFFDSRLALKAIYHPNPEQLNLGDEFGGVDTEWKSIVSRIKAIFAETPIKMSRLGNTKKEKDRLFEQAQYVVDEINGQFDIAAKL